MKQVLKKYGMGFMLGLVAVVAVAEVAQAGVFEPPPNWSQILPADRRFELVMGGGAVLDRETGLVWEQSPSIFVFNWGPAQFHCNQLSTGNRLGWRLPTLQELASLIDRTQANPSLPSGHPFSNVQSSSYWSATTNAIITTGAWDVNFSHGGVGSFDKSNDDFVWCVRGGQGVDPQ